MVSKGAQSCACITSRAAGCRECPANDFVHRAKSQNATTSRWQGALKEREMAQCMRWDDEVTSNTSKITSCGTVSVASVSRSAGPSLLDTRAPAQRLWRSPSGRANDFVRAEPWFQVKTTRHHRFQCPLLCNGRIKTHDSKVHSQHHQLLLGTRAGISATGQSICRQGSSTAM